MATSEPQAPLAKPLLCILFRLLKSAQLSGELRCDEVQTRRYGFGVLGNQCAKFCDRNAMIHMCLTSWPRASRKYPRLNLFCCELRCNGVQTRCYRFGVIGSECAKFCDKSTTTCEKNDQVGIHTHEFCVCTFASLVAHSSPTPVRHTHLWATTRQVK